MDKEVTTRVVLADDHDVIRQGLKRLLNRAPEIEVVGEASDGLEAIQSVQELQPDVLLLDIEMPFMDGVEVARRLREMDVPVRILVLSAYDDREYIRALLDIGVSGYLVKGEAPGKIIEAVRGLAQDQKGWVSPQIRKKLEKLSNNVDGFDRLLSYRDLYLLRLLASERIDEQICRQMGLSEAEYLSTTKALYQKMRVHSRFEAVKLALKEGWISKLDIE